MADRTFTEGEAYALVADAVQRETAAAATRISELEATLKSANDVLVAEKAAETQRADQAAQALIDFKDGIERETARVALRTERVAAVADATDLLEMTDERAERIVAMDEAAFASYVSDLREIAAKAPPFTKKDDEDSDAKADAKGGDDKDGDDAKDKADKAKAKGRIPRESAAFGGSTSTAKSQGSVIGVIGASRALRTG
jgi:hypothetical protein